MFKYIPFLVLSLLSACTVGPNYHRPPVIVPQHFKEAKGKAFQLAPNKEWKLAQPCDLRERGHWWKIFNEPELDELEARLNLCNQNIVNAVANYWNSRAIVDEARAGFYPTLNATFSVLRQKLGGGGTTFSTVNGETTSTGVATTGNTVATSIIKTTYSAFLDANWEPDIWGLVRRTVEADASAAQANQALIAVTRLSAQGSLAQYYFELRTLDADQQLLNRTVQDYKKALQLTRNQYRSGVASRADILQAESQLETAQAQAINNGILRGQYEHAIAVLIGLPPADFSLPARSLRGKPPLIPVVIPSVWLERRPDIAQAERLMQQANAQIGVAVAAYYPTLDLSASVSAAGRSLSQLIHKPSIGWAYGLQVANTLFDGGYRNATVRAAKANYLAQVASYRQTVLSAFQDVEDNLINLRLLEQQIQVQRQAAQSARRAVQLVMNQYREGIVPYSSVITAQINAYSAEKAAIDVQGLEMSGAVGLIKSLGGGWDSNRIQGV